MQNHSDVPVMYDWQLDAEDCFSINRPRGVIAPLTTGHVTVSFRSPVPACYWKRAVCLIKDADPLSLDLLATAYDDKSRPPPFTARHIEGYISRVATGGAPVEVDPATVSVPPSIVGSYHGGGGGSRPDSGRSGSELGSEVLLAPTGLGTVDPASQKPLVGPTSWQLLFEVRQNPPHNYWVMCEIHTEIHTAISHFQVVPWTRHDTLSKAGCLRPFPPHHHVDPSTTP